MDALFATMEARATPRIGGSQNILVGHRARRNALPEIRRAFTTVPSSSSTSTRVLIVEPRRLCLWINAETHAREQRPHVLTVHHSVRELLEPGSAPQKQITMQNFMLNFASSSVLGQWWMRASGLL